MNRSTLFAQISLVSCLLLLATACNAESDRVIPEGMPPQYSGRLSETGDEISNSRRNAITRSVELVSPAVVGINVTEIRQRQLDPFWQMFYGERTYSERSGMQVVRAVGGRAPLHLTSVGKLFLAQDDPQRVRAYATRTGLAGHTRNSITALPALERELNSVRINGMARDDEELELGVRCMAAGIYDDQGHLIAGLSISAPADRLEDAWLERLKATAGQISSALGYRGPAVRPAEPLRATR